MINLPSGTRIWIADRIVCVSSARWANEAIRLAKQRSRNLGHEQLHVLAAAPKTPLASVQRRP